MRIGLWILLIGTALSACGKGVSSCSSMAAERPAAGGVAGTIQSTDKQAFALPMPVLSRADERRFFKGRALFRDIWVAAPASTSSRDGLGPFFNARACEGCHVRDGRGRPPRSPDEAATSMLIRLSVPSAQDGGQPVGNPAGDPSYGGQLQPLSLNGVPAEGALHVDYEERPGTYADGAAFTLRAPRYRIENLGYGPLHPHVMMSPRVAPAMSGLGLLEAVSAADLLAHEDADDRDGDGISGRANWPVDVKTGQPALGRFGWKSNQPTVEQQTAGAFNGDIGITSTLFPTEDCTPAQLACLAAATGDTPQLDPTILANVSFYARTLAVPGRRALDEAQVQAGEEMFATTGCAGCHVTTFMTSAFPPVPELAGQTIHPYTDLLLHDLGDGLADGRPDVLATGREWRTPPLWGIGLLTMVNDHTFLLHDGRARSIEEAILWHGGEAAPARERFRMMERGDREAILAFLSSL